MDPQTSWDSLRQAYAAENWPEAIEIARALLGWLNRGGFPPMTTSAPPMDDHWNRQTAILCCRITIRRAKGAMSCE